MSNDVFFLGAGFSIALANLCITNDKKYPSLATLTKEILNENLGESLNVCLSKIPSKHKENIELLLTYLSTDAPWQEPQIIHQNKALYFEIISRMAAYFNNLGLECSYNFEPLKAFSRYIIDSKSPIITLNYDTLLEKLLFSIMSKEYQKANTYRGFYKQPIVDLFSRVSHRSAGIFGKPDYDFNGDKLPPIYKLHGSINWLWLKTNQSDPVYCATGREHKTLRKVLSKYIIPPVLDKSEFYNHNIIKSIWSDAYSALNKAERIFIIGFSFPITDLSIKSLFNSAVDNANSKANIYVINTADSVTSQSTNYIKNRYDDIFSKMCIDYTYCCDNSLEKFVKEFIELELNTKNDGRQKN